jgi:NADH-quinone oxidoreductase subunit C/D
MGDLMLNLRDDLYQNFGTDFKSSFSDKGLLTYQARIPFDDDSVKSYQNFFRILKEDFKFHMLVDFCIEESAGKRLAHYQFLNLEVFFYLQVTVDLQDSDFLVSLSSLWSSAETFEEDVIKHYSIFITDGTKTAQRRDLQTRHLEQDKDIIPSLPIYETPLQANHNQKERSWHRFGPHSAPFNGKVRVDLLIAENRVYDSRVLAGLHHRGFETKALGKEPLALIFQFERLCARDSVYAPLLWVETLEEIHHITVPDKAKAIRMVWMELARVEGHLNFLWELTHELGFYVSASVFAELLEQVYHLFNLYSGKSQNYSLFTVGGMRKANPIGWGTECLEAAKYILKIIEEQEKGFNRNPRFMEVTSGFPMSAGLALDHGFSGPNLRACGVNLDNRKTKPRYFYDDVDFEVPLGIDGTTYDRFLVRLEELKQSLRIINQVLDHLPAGSVLNKDHAFYRPEFDGQASEVRMNMSHQEWPAKDLEVFSHLEATEGLLGYYIKIESGKLTKLHVRSPSLVHLGAYPKIVRGGELSGALTTFQSLSIDAWEMDR